MDRAGLDSRGVYVRLRSYAFIVPPTGYNLPKNFTREKTFRLLTFISKNQNDFYEFFAQLNNQRGILYVKRQINILIHVLR